MRERTEQHPVTHEEPGRKETRETHPAYALIGASRTSHGGGGAYLFGSDFRHSQYVVIRISEGSMMRTVSHDWPLGGSRNYIEVALSEAQWAAFVSRLNMGEGVPCTLSFRMPCDADEPNAGFVPEIASVTDRREQFKGEVADQLRDIVAEVDGLLQLLADETLSKKARERIETAVKMVRQHVASNLPFVAKSFDEHVDRAMTSAKMEIGAYVQSAVQRAGLQALGATESPFELADGKADAMIEESRREKE